MPAIPETVEIDFLILADRAEVINGKMYMMGGGWDQRFAAHVAEPVNLNMTIGILVPWNLTNEPHQLQVRIEHEDGTVIPPEVSGSVTVGRPTQSTKGQLFRAMASIDGRWKLPQFGGYSVVASLVNGVEKRTVFYFIQKPASAQAALL